ncbi:helix-turn-helix domain-containing protein [Streptomyces sp. NPDC015350]|uniref:helix-turn-helix domain-containing protein n=1 Tax=Streptomyces sp. NPDC015350 TaxID=3364955 RepID=UPI0036F78AC8
MLNDIRFTRKELPSGYRLVVHVPPYPGFATPARLLGGVLNKNLQNVQRWHFDPRSEKRVRDLCISIWGTDGTLHKNNDLVALHWGFDDLPWEKEVWLVGRLIAFRPHRDSHVQLGWGVTLLQGGFFESGGSIKNPRLDPKKGTVLEIRDVPRGIAKSVQRTTEGITVVEPENPGPPLPREDLQARREELLEELSFLNQLLKDNQGPDAEPLRCRCGRHECPPVGYTPAEVAELASVTSQTVISWCRTGKIPAVRNGGRWIVLHPLPQYVRGIPLPPPRWSKETSSH